MTQHHLAGQDHRPGIDLVLIRVFRRSAVRRLEHGMARHIIDVAARRDADAADLRGERVGQIVAVQIRCRDDVELVRPCQDLLQGNVRNRILDHEARAGLPVGDLAPGSAVDLDGAVEVLRHLVAPVAEGALGELHDVPFVHQGHALPLALDRVPDRAVDQALGPETADLLEADAHLHRHVAVRRADRLELLLPLLAPLGGPEADLAEFFREFFGEEVEYLLRLRRACCVFDTRVDVFRILAEDHHIDLLRMLDRRRNALEPPDRSETNEQVEHLPQRDVQRSDAAADRRRQWSLDANEVGAKRFNRFVRKPVIELLETLFAGVDFLPGDCALATVGFPDSCIEHTHARAPDVGAGAVAFDERNDRIVRDDETFGFFCDCSRHDLGQLTCRARKISANIVEKSVENDPYLRGCYARFRMF